MLRSCFDAVNPAPHLDHVGIQLEDAPLRQQHFHPDRVVRLQSFPDPGAALPEEDRPGALVRDRGRSTNRFPFPFLSPRGPSPSSQSPRAGRIADLPISKGAPGTSQESAANRSSGSGAESLALLRTSRRPDRSTSAASAED